MGEREYVDNFIMHLHGIPNAISRNQKFNKKLNIFVTITSIIITILIFYAIYSKKGLTHRKFCGIENMYNQPFYIELMSNSTSFKNNTVANFKNKVSLLRALQGYWEVALVEISYTKSWKNLRNDMKICITNDTYISTTADRSNSINVYSTINDTPHCGYVRAGHYSSIQILISEIEREMEPLKRNSIEKLPKLTFDNITKLITISPGKHKDGQLMLPKLSKEVAEIFGFDNYSTVNPEYNKFLQLVADRPAELDAGLHTLFVYADLIEPQYIGDTRAKLIRSIEVPPEKSYGETVVLKYDNPHYIPVLVTDFESIEIDIKDDSNTTIPFMFGRTRLKLHFRQKNV